MDSLAIVSEPPTQMPVGDVIGTRRTGRILVAEDDVHMRRLVARALRTTGYRVVEAADGVEVLSRIESTIWHDRHDVIRAVVADIWRVRGIDRDVTASVSIGVSAGFTLA